MTAKIAVNAVTSAKIATSGVVTGKILDANVTLAKLAATARRHDITLRMEGVAALDELLGGNSTTGFNFVSSVRISNARLVWQSSTTGAAMRVTLYKNALTICQVGTTVASDNDWFAHESTSGDMNNNTLQSTDEFRARVAILSNVKVSTPPVLRIQYEDQA